MSENRLASDKRLVWDLPLRLFHWLLVISIAGSWYTAEKSAEGEFVEIGDMFLGYAQIHFYIGYWTLGLIAFRLIWGFVGPRHARFSSFITGPSRTMTYLRSLGSPSYKPVAGHNPLGAWSVVLLLAIVSAQAISGLFIIDNTEIYPAPFHQSVEYATAAKLQSFHFFNFDVLLWAIGLHVAAILFYLVVKHQNLIAAMITGRKPANLVPASEAITSSQWLKALIVIVVVTLAVWFLLQQAPEPVYEDYN